MSRKLALLFSVLLAATAVPASAITIDFEEFSNGEAVAAPVGSHDGYTLIVDRFSSDPDTAVAYDTSRDQRGSTQTQLGFRNRNSAGSSLAGSDLGNVLVLPRPCLGQPCARPGPGGSLTFLLDGLADSLSFDFVDFGGSSGQVSFLLRGRGRPAGLPTLDELVASYSFSELGIVGSGQQVTHVDLVSIGLFNTIEFVMSGDGGLDNLSTGSTNPVPEPASAVLLGLGLAALALAGRSPR